MKDSALGKKAATLLYAAVTILIIWLLLRYAVGWLLPFIAAFCLARILEPAVRLLHTRLKLTRSVAAALCAVFTIAALATLISLIVARATFALSAFARRLAEPSGNFPEKAAALLHKVRDIIDSAPIELQIPIRSALEELPGKGTAESICNNPCGWRSKGAF